MPLLLISTSLRYSRQDQPSGHLFVYDLEKQTILRQSEIIEPPYRNADPNPRGGFRGLKGISIDGDQVAIANASTVFLYDHNWQPITYFWHPSCSGIHDIELINDQIWVTSSRNDLLLCFDKQGSIVRHYDLRKSKIVKALAPRRLRSLFTDQQVLSGKIDFRDPRTHDLAITDTLHINSLAFLDNGDLLISCGLFRVVDKLQLHKLNNFLKMHPLLNRIPGIIRKIKPVMITKDKEGPFEAAPISSKQSFSLLLRIDQNDYQQPGLMLTDCKYPSHSIRILQDRSALYLNTTSGEIVHFNPITNEILSETKIGTKFLRGARQLPDGSLMVGDNNFLIHFDLENQQVISKLPLTEDAAEAVFDINILPQYFELPPLSFVKLHERLLPVEQEKRT